MWLDGKTVEKVAVSPLSHSLHYGGAVYEGIRFYQTQDGRRAIFRLNDHLKRLLVSAVVMRMKIPYSLDQLMQATIAEVRQSGLEEGYIRPIVFRGEGLGLMSRGNVAHTLIAVVPWVDGPESTTLAFSHMIRMHPVSTVITAKVAGHYVNSYLAAAEAQDRGADDALLLDYQGNVAEASVANVFIVKGDSVITPPSGNIFCGITRDTVIRLLDVIRGQKVEERTVSPIDALFRADAMFVAGTAAEVLPVAKLDDRDFDVGNKTVVLCRDLYRQAITGALSGAPDCWLAYVD